MSSKITWSSSDMSNIRKFGADSPTQPWVDMDWPNKLGSIPADAMGGTMQVEANGNVGTFWVIGHEGDRLYLRDMTAQPMTFFDDGRKLSDAPN